MKNWRLNILKIGYLVKHFVDYGIVPRWFYRLRRKSILCQDGEIMQHAIAQRVAYYNSIETPMPLCGGQRVDDFRFPFWKKKRFSTYFFDLYDVLKYFDKDKRFLYIFGDVTTVPPRPTFVKSRPIGGDNANAVLMKLNRFRHFTLIKNDKPFREKKDMLVGRTTWANSSVQRRLLYEKYGNHPLCDVGKTRRECEADLPYTIKPYLSRRRQLDYKFIASIEGNDVATNLKWIAPSYI